MDKRELKAMAETEARLLAVIEGRAAKFVTASREQAEREYQTALQAARDGVPLVVEPGSLR